MLTITPLLSRRNLAPKQRVEILEQSARVARIATRQPSLDVRTADRWSQRVAAFAEGGRAVAVDMSDVRSIDSAGLGAIVAAVKLTRDAGGDVALYAVTPDVRVLLELVRLHQFVDIYNDAAEVIRSGFGETEGAVR